MLGCLRACMVGAAVLVSALAALAPASVAAARLETLEKPCVIVLADITNELDDGEWMVRSSDNAEPGSSCRIHEPINRKASTSAGAGVGVGARFGAPWE